MTTSEGDRVDVDPARPLRTLGVLLGRDRARLALAVGVFVVKDSPLWLLPLITSAAIDAVVDRRTGATLPLLVVAAAALLAQNYPLHVLFTRLYMSTVRRIGADLRNALTAQLQVLSIGFHTRMSAAIIQSKIVRDVENVEVMLTQVGNPALSATFVFVGAIVTTALAVPSFLPVFALTIPVAVAIRWVARRRSERRNRDFRQEVEDFSLRVGEMAALVPITRAHGLERIAVERVAVGAEGVRASGYRLDLMNGRFNAVSWVAFQTLSVGCVLLAASAALLGWIAITPGQIVLVGSYFTSITGAVSSLLTLVPLLSRGSESIRSIGEVLADPDLELNEGRRVVGEVRGRIRLDHLVYRYDEGERAALDDVSLDIAPGETVAVVGSSGSGKSTLLNVVLGFVRPTDGRLLIDEQDIQALDMRSVRRSMSVVPQESVLFGGTIEANITYGLGEVAPERLASALAAANAQEVVDALPEGLRTVVGERGARLSGGQRQRLSIARALIRDPRILLLDEATSALDSESEGKVREALATLMRDRTTLVVAHRLSTVRAADRIVVLEHGRVVEVGSHDRLVVAGGRYARLWRLQFS